MSRLPRDLTKIILGGFIIIVVGLFLILLSGGGTNGGFFVVFPFLVFGTSDPVFSILALIVGIISSVFVYLQILAVKRSEAIHRGYVAVDLICEHCESPIPLDSSFCPACGKPVQ